MINKEKQVIIYELEEDPRFFFQDQPKEVQDEILKKNDEYGKLVLEPILDKKIEQLGEGRYEFGAVIVAHHGVHSHLVYLVVRNTDTDQMHLYGDMEPLVHILAEGYNSFFDQQAKADLEQKREAPVTEDMIIGEGGGAANDGNPEFMLEDPETGEMVAADDIAKQLFGGA